MIAYILCPSCFVKFEHSVLQITYDRLYILYTIYIYIYTLIYFCTSSFLHALCQFSKISSLSSSLLVFLESKYTNHNTGADQGQFRHQYDIRFGHPKWLPTYGMLFVLLFVTRSRRDIKILLGVWSLQKSLVL